MNEQNNQIEELDLEKTKELPVLENIEDAFSDTLVDIFNDQETEGD